MLRSRGRQTYRREEQRDIVSIHMYFYVKCGSTTLTFTCVSKDIEIYNIDVLTALKQIIYK